MKKAQISVEYLFIIGLALAILVPGSIMFYNYSQESNNKLVAGQINRIGKNIINQAEQMNAIGKNSWTTIEANLPETTRNIYAKDYELVITYQTDNGLSESVFFSDINIKGEYTDGEISPAFHSGTMKIKIEAKEGYVSISERTS
ncbi:MAG: class III signal peptide-containing protein [Nanoarchaeota archaeon]|nr:class III signal peptide-containing protein [Nanoarchaeota archaeon]MBU1854543.1 class III signal peptide-containing protein [Nanoarchaeota archaeon]